MTRIRELRQGRGLSVIDLAFETRIHPSLLSCVERRKSAASDRVKNALSSFFGVDESSVFEHDGLAL
ncbi:MAG: helix-turn-helix transcriptional regulator [Synergistaceae bacterium]|jgi:transcriptional regulator with XRE-family HTH domain|nr:helix-turn-helix transcriptional regulator [Synergistaceae bacterium]